ncbi:MAG: porin [Planctomycetota bacterium]
MQRLFTTAAIAGALATGFAGSASAQSEVEQLRAEMAQMRAEMAQLKAQQEGDWLNEARAAEVRGLINEVMADANTRASLLQEGALAGIDSKGKVFLKSADGDFSMNLSGQIQFRYTFNNYEGRGDESISGFSMRRSKLKVAGDIAEDWSYTLVFAGDRDGGTSGNVFWEDAVIHYEISPELTVNVGVKKLPFARQELISSTRQVAVDRGFATEFFTLNRGEGVELEYEKDNLRGWVMLSDGTNNPYSDFNVTGGGAAHDFAITARGDYMAIGDDWGQSKHAFGGVEDTHLFIGAAVNYGQLEFGGAAADEQLNWTLDAILKTGNWGFMAGIFGSHTDANPGGADSDAFAFFGQADYKIGDTKWDIFARYDHIDDDTADELDAITLGANYHFTKKVKFTGDVVWIIDSDNPDALGFLADGEDSDGVGVTGLADNTGEDMFILRLQLQLLF